MEPPTECPEALGVLFQDKERPLSLVMEILDRVADWSIIDLLGVRYQIAKVKSGDLKPLLESQLIDLAAAAHNIWEDGYNVGRGIDSIEKGGE